MRSDLVFSLFALFLFQCYAIRIEVPLQKIENEETNQVNSSVILEEEEIGSGYNLQKLTEDEVTDWPHDDEQIVTERTTPPVIDASEPDETQVRVFEGTSASTGQFPFVVYIKATQIEDGSIMNCGGALVSDNYVVTAAQCVANAVTIAVVGGVLDPEDPAASVSPGIANVHPGFRRNFMVNDIALVKLLVPFTLGVNIYPIKLTKAGNPNNLDLATVRIYGWGTTDKSIGSALNYVELVQLSKSSCQSQTVDNWIEYPAMTSCISSTANTNGFCTGDIGGPVSYTYAGDAATSLVGVLSQFQGCPSRYPMSYTRVGPYLGWIKSIVKNLLRN